MQGGRAGEVQGSSTRPHLTRVPDMGSGAPPEKTLEGHLDVQSPQAPARRLGQPGPPDPLRVPGPSARCPPPHPHQKLLGSSRRIHALTPGQTGAPAVGFQAPGDVSKEGTKVPTVRKFTAPPGAVTHGPGRGGVCSDSGHLCREAAPPFQILRSEHRPRGGEDGGWAGGQAGPPRRGGPRGPRTPAGEPSAERQLGGKSAVARTTRNQRPAEASCRRGFTPGLPPPSLPPAHGPGGQEGTRLTPT